MTAVQNINDRMAPQHAQCEQRNKLMRELETNAQELRASVKNLRKRNGQIESASTRRVGRYVEIQNELDEIREQLRNRMQNELGNAISHQNGQIIHISEESEKIQKQMQQRIDELSKQLSEQLSEQQQDTPNKRKRDDHEESDDHTPQEQI